jgi:hypothetical protein
MPVTYDSLYTRVKNVSGGSRFFSYLGPHGTTLANNGTYDVVGDLTQYLMSGPSRSTARRLAALQSDLANDRIAILHSPALLLQDASSLAVKAITLDTTLDVADPSYGSYSG